MNHSKETTATRSVGGDRYRLVVIAASAGGVEAIGEVLSAFPADFPVPIAIVLHRSNDHRSLLARVLSRRTPLAVKLAEQAEKIQSGTVYLAPPNLHLQVVENSFVLADGRPIRYVLSSANPLFESAAEAFDGRLIAVVLSGSGSDATDGVQAVREAGGVVLVQDPLTCEHSSMPVSAINTGCVNQVLPLKAIGPAVLDLVKAHGGSNLDPNRLGDVCS